MIGEQGKLNFTEEAVSFVPPPSGFLLISERDILAIEQSF
jgi:hypothetical protein